MNPPHACDPSLAERLYFAPTFRTTSKKFLFEMRFLVAQNAGIFLAKKVRISSMRLWSRNIVIARLLVVCRRVVLSLGQVDERCESLEKPTTASSLRTEVREAHGMVG